MGNHVTTTYDADGETLTVTDALNRTTTYTYSVRGWVATDTDPMGYLATYTYTRDRQKLGDLSKSRPSWSRRRHMTYDADDRLIASGQRARSRSPRTTYDGVGNVTSVEGPEHKRRYVCL